MPSDIDPYYMFLGISPKERPINYYRLLGLDQFETNTEIISMAADRQMGHLQRHESGDHIDEVAKLLSEVSRARLCLLNPEKKAAYDEKIRAEQTSTQQPADSPAEPGGVTTSIKLRPPLPPPSPEIASAPQETPAEEQPVEFKCHQCGVQLRARRKDEGKQIRCPKCSSVSTVPIDAEIVPDDESTPQPFLNDPVASLPNPMFPVATNPYLPPTSAPMATPFAPKRRTLRPHRGGTILTFGILGIFCCGIFGICAWVMANTDLQQMDRGVMDPDGRSSTQAGKILGIVMVCLYVLYFLLQCVIIGTTSR